MIFSEEQVSFIKSLGLDLDFENLSDDDWRSIEDVVADKLELSGFDENYNVTPIGTMCESILDLLE